MARTPVPPLRAEPFSPDPFDGQRVEYVKKLWHSQDAALRARDRAVEENIRMLAGQQWIFWSDLLNKFVDITRLLTDDERRWRQRPVINRLLYWFMLTHARMTENPPVIAFQPSTGDRIDAELAEVMDTVHKTLWNEIGMLEVLDRLFAWLIPSGRAYLYSRVDPLRGEVREWMGPAVVPVVDENGVQVGERFIPEAPFDAEGRAQVQASTDGSVSFTGEPHREYEGGIVVDVLTALEVRGTWDNKPWQEKDWHIHKSFVSPDELRQTFGVEVEPDMVGASAEGAGELERLLFGNGHFGAVENRGLGNSHQQAREETGLCTVYTLWMRPRADVPGMQQTDDVPGGRLLIVTESGQVVRDGPRPAPFRGTSPIQAFDFVNVPGRPHGTTPQEMLNPIQRTYNRGWAQILEHRNLSTNPIGVIDHASGINEGQITNRPGTIFTANKRAGVAPFEYVAPPQLSADVWRTQDQLAHTFDELGNVHGAEGNAPTEDASGELVKELRFNADRFIGPAMRRSTQVLARVVEDWIAILPTLWDQQKIITYAGDDQVARTVVVMPEMFKGRVNVTADIESMLPEGRGERQARIRAWYQEGVFGQPGSPEAIRKYMELARFPHLSRAAQPGGVHRVTAQQENGKLVQGATAEEIPLLEWYDDLVHLEAHYEFMAAPEYLKLPLPVQQAFYDHTEQHHLAMMAKQMKAQQRQMQLQAGMLAQQVQANAATMPLQQIAGVQGIAAQAPAARIGQEQDAEGLALSEAARGEGKLPSRNPNPPPATAAPHQPRSVAQPR